MKRWCSRSTTRSARAPPAGPRTLRSTTRPPVRARASARASKSVPSRFSDSGFLIMAELAGTPFLDALQGRVDETLDACTRCGKCVEACPMVEPAGLDKSEAVPIVDGILDLLAGGAGTA